MQGNRTMQNEASEAQETIAMEIQHRLRRSCGRVSDMTGEPESTRRVGVAGCAGDAQTPRRCKSLCKRATLLFEVIPQQKLKIETAIQKRF